MDNKMETIVQATSVGSYLSALYSLIMYALHSSFVMISGLTLSDWSIVVSIMCSILMLLVNSYFQHRNTVLAEKRLQLELNGQLKNKANENDANS